MIVQDDLFPATESGTICLVTTDTQDARLFRLPVQPSETNGLRTPSRLMTDKIGTIPKSKLGHRVGRLADEDIVRLNRAMMLFLSLATPVRRAR